MARGKKKNLDRVPGIPGVDQLIGRWPSESCFSHQGEHRSAVVKETIFDPFNPESGDRFVRHHELVEREDEGVRFTDEHEIPDEYFGMRVT